MKHDLTLEQLFDFLQKQQMVFSVRQKEQIARYYDLLRLWGGRQNLLSRNDMNCVVERHFLTSFYYAYKLQQQGFVRQRVLDLGSGAGLPGVLLSIYFQKSSYALLDASRKKALFLRRVVGELGLRAQVLLVRAEQLNLTEEERFPVVVARAVAPTGNLVHLTSFLIKKRGVLYSLKGEGELDGLVGEVVSQARELPMEQDWLEFTKYLKGKRMLRLEF